MHMLTNSPLQTIDLPMAASATSSAFLLLLLFFFFFPIFVQPQSTNFIFNGFNGSEASLAREGASITRPAGALELTNKSQNLIGHAFYAEHIQMLQHRNDSSSAPSTASSFSTTFVFVIIPPGSRKGGHGLAFTLSPSVTFPGAEAGHYLGLFNSYNNNKSSNHILAVEFDTVNGFGEASDNVGNHVGININSMSSVVTEPACYYINNTSKKEEMQLEDGDPIRAWIDYDGVRKLLNVTICPSLLEKPTKPLISHPLDLSPYVKEVMFVGFSASTGNKASSHFILGWSFSMNGEAPPLDLSLLPPSPPKEEDPSSLDHRIIGLISALAALIALLLGILFYFAVYRRMAKHEDLEDWELDCPHRFHYRDLYTATGGFRDSKIIGIGGFGAVYKGVLPTTGAEVAVKKITRNSIQGLREFAAEIESLGRLRHKNLVNLQGWCKRKNDLLLVYEYIPNGGLDSLLFDPRNNFVLSWEQRFNVLRGISAGLLYLHEEWEQVVIHRDVKSSNVLIDAEMNARLGDFGLARLYDHGTLSHTTNVVGTIGYIAPELARNGKASASSDVFAFGVLVLEAGTGRRPVDSGNFFLVDWVMDLHERGQILDAVDPMLGSITDVAEEVKLVLQLGLLCSHHKPESRPSMRKVMQYLNGEERLPLIESSGSFDSIIEMNSRFLEVISSDMIPRSYRSSSISGFSAGSLGTGR
ncbi:lectin-domain containing receptor kinase VI.4-like [Malania oleifera]|uniref:lectin-domain containing receptor kinase VI.4-like n=1 Tax=Malania oleifera TaxID=397392 RepID=UPI0025AEC717|nr:lectin-domain containing receptor kinase VI.4-like [Malania oleifera]